MNNESFIKGFLYGLSFAESLNNGKPINKAAIACIYFKDQSHIMFEINHNVNTERHNKLVLMLLGLDQTNVFDLHTAWILDGQEEKINTLGYEFDEDNRLRLNFDELIKVVNVLGEIDYDVTQQLWLEYYFKSYYKIKSNG